MASEGPLFCLPFICGWLCVNQQNIAALWTLVSFSRDGGGGGVVMMEVWSVHVSGGWESGADGGEEWGE